MKGPGIYRIVHVATGREYIGQAACIATRWKGHRRALNGGYHHNPGLQAAWLKHGHTAFAFEVIDQCGVPDLTAREQHAFDIRNPYFNVAPAAGSTRGAKQSAEAVAKKVGRKPSAETRAKMSAARAGRPISDEQRLKISATLTGRKRPPEVAAKMSAALKGRPLSDETKRRMSESRTGAKYSAERVAKSVATKARNRVARVAVERRDV